MNIFSKLSEVKVEIREIHVKEYRLKYLFGAWVTDHIIYAESDEEAIYESDERMKELSLDNSVRDWQLTLFDENYKVIKRY